MPAFAAYGFLRKGGRGRQLGIDGYVYVPEALSLPNALVNIFKAYDHYLYYKKMYDTGLTTIKGISADDGEDREITVYVPYGDLADFCVDEEGAVYYFLQNYIWSSDYSSVTYKGGCLIKMLPDGRREYLLELPETNIVLNYSSCLAVDSKNQVLLVLN